MQIVECPLYFAINCLEDKEIESKRMKKFEWEGGEIKHIQAKYLQVSDFSTIINDTFIIRSSPNYVKKFCRKILSIEHNLRDNYPIAKVVNLINPDMSHQVDAPHYLMHRRLKVVLIMNSTIFHFNFMKFVFIWTLNIGINSTIVYFIQFYAITD